MDKALTIKERIMAFLDRSNIKKIDFYSTTGIEASNFKGKNKTSQPGSDMLVKILTLYPQLSAEWLLTGRGSMIKDSNIPIAQQATNSHDGIPLIPFSAMAGALTGENSVLEYECERYIVPAFKGADFLIPIKGDSMQPTYKSGDIVACQRLPMTNLFFQWNRPYVLDTAQGALIKRIQPGKDQQHVLIVSDNEQYAPFELPYSEIYSVATVIGLIRME